MNDIKRLSIGDLSIAKGEIRDGVILYAWDSVPDCSVSDCIVFDKCKYIKQGRCAVQLHYLQALYGAILGTYSTLDDAMLFKIGMQIVPLYAHLIKLQMVELSLDSPIEHTDKGTPYVHPVYKEIRETMKTIFVMWKDLDVTFSYSFKPALKPGEETAVDFERGDPTYYKRITEDNKSMKGVVR